MFMTVSDAEWTTLSATFTTAGFTCDATTKICSSATKTCAEYTTLTPLTLTKTVDLDNGTTNTSVFTIPVLGYTFRTQAYVANAACVVAITGGAAADTVTLGTYFLASYYTEFDYTTNMIGFSTNSNSVLGSTLAVTSAPTSTFFAVTLTNTKNTWTGPLSLGTPAQKQSLTYTTASPSTLV